ncbi:benign gonial cell neoplasm protein isoform X3 [Episyrphus balteatus]|nr:benign gonial cell neoplasm protein isoform X3 [Episyrphus balteatus]
MDILTFHYILENLLKFDRNKCCTFFIGPFYNVGSQVDTQIFKLGLKTQYFIVHGHKIKRIYNIRCCHCVTNPRSFYLTQQSKKIILFHLKLFENDGFQRDGLPSFFFKSSRLTPMIIPKRFTIAPLRCNTFHSDIFCKEMVSKTWRLYPFKMEILKNIEANRVLVINGDVSLEKSTAVPLTIVEECLAKDSYCKIICLESDNLTAILNSTFIADHLNEKIGGRVGFQVYLQSRVCDNTNIIYTTAFFFLRVLMGQDSKNSFRYISHVIISDVHLHHAYKDIFLKELKNILPHYPFIKIILLSDTSDNRNFLSYFGEGQEICLNIKLNKLSLYHLDEIIELIQQNQLQTKSVVEEIFSSRDIKNNTIANNALEYYNAVGDEKALKSFMYLVKCNEISIDYHHANDSYTALIAAVKHDDTIQVTWLLTRKNANSFNQDTFKINALEYAISINSYNCVRAITDDIYKCDLKPPPVDFDLIIKLIHLATTHWTLGNILVFLPSYDHLLKLKYAILKTQFLGKIQEKIYIQLIYPCMQPEQLQKNLLIRETGKIILATEIAEHFSNLNDITYVIDSGQIVRQKYYSEFKCNKYVNEWVSLESLKRRSLIASRFTDGFCFRLVSQKIYNKLRPTCPPELHYIPINRLSLTVKLLSPCSVVTHYFEDTIIKPPAENIAQGITFLKNIEFFDTNLELTWLGSRLVDIPIELELSKSLVLSILLKCLDPVLTIVSFLTYSSSSKLFKHKSTDDKSELFEEFRDCFSDYLKFLRLYQTWQDEKRTKITSDIISDEKTFILNGVLENVCEIRTNLVGALRSSQLIHNQGILSMHSINLKANNWACIKAALAGGLYPKLCMINYIDGDIKSKSTKLCLDITSLLQSSNLQTFNSSTLSEWIVYFTETNHTTLNSISICTLINSATVSLFAGKIEMNVKNVCFDKGHPGYFIDENIWLKTDFQSALLAFKLRERFYECFMEYLQNCTNIEKWRKPNDIFQVVDVISKILFEEDKNAGFPQPTHIGHRPKAITNKFIRKIEVHSNCNNFDLKNKVIEGKAAPLLNNAFMEEEFFLINIFDSCESLKSFWKLPITNLINNPQLKAVSHIASKDKLAYVLVCSATRKCITHIALIQFQDGEFMFKNCFQVNIPQHEVIITCTVLKLNLPSFCPNWMPHKIDKEIGQTILDLWYSQNK